MGSNTRAVLTRRGLLARAGGLAGIALTELLARDGVLRLPRRPPRARRVIQLFMSGAASQCDLFDYKPLLAERAGEPFDPGGKVELFQSEAGVVMPSPWRFARHGGCGRWMSELVPNLATCVDDIAFLFGMSSRSNVHGPATLLAGSGSVRPGYPSFGAWLSWGLGSENDDLPTFVALPDARGYAPNGRENWTAGFLPATHQGVELRPGAREPLAFLYPPDGAGVEPAQDADALALLAELNGAHRAERPGDSRLDARLAAYVLAARMQTSAPEALDVGSESAATRRLYGLDEPETADLGRRCLVARRLVERGVRFVQVWSGADNGFPRRNWDSHEDLARDHGTMGRGMDRPAAALLKDLKARGLLDDTVLLWTTEFGRMPCSQGAQGRDHNPFGFTTWMAGGGVRGGTAYGATDEWSFRAAEGETSGWDVHATVLHLLGLDHERLTFRHEGLDRRLTDVHGRVIEDILT